MGSPAPRANALGCLPRRLCVSMACPMKFCSVFLFDRRAWPPAYSLVVLPCTDEVMSESSVTLGVVKWFAGLGCIAALRPRRKALQMFDEMLHL
uniref:Uncharacterized protein n=1 Tax=Oryza meridionalis TaxID=40149 RepID=A0A0E0DFK7_9ORYZ